MEQREIENAEKHIRNAWIVGIISTAMTVVVSLVGAYDEDFRYSSGFDTWTLFDAALIAALTYGIYKKSRFSALGLLIYFVLSKFIAAASDGQFPFGLGALLFGYFYLMGTISAFKLYAHNKRLTEQESGPKKRSVVFYALTGFGVLVVGLFIWVIVISADGPGTEVIPGRQLKAKYVEFALNEGLLDPEERIQFWYSDAFSDFTDGFYFFTDKKVVVYNKTWEEPALLMPFDSIQNISFRADPSFLEDSQLFLELTDGTYVNFPVSSDKGGDQRFHKRLRTLWKKTQAAQLTDTHPEQEEEQSEVTVVSYE
ncbi:hypothetical protein [uncultured Pontibacter sp.]|uniref:hypothetical protein n=1 Tax=uncultured Pontibacter sp. TaxID=453356 RepID=UPI002638047C|nr:hypothetical protein [uncultured Pontibacter sp.]